MWSVTVAVLLLAQAPDNNQPAGGKDPPNCAQHVNAAERDRELEGQLRPLLRDLRSGSLQEREQAEQKLLDFGTRVLDHLPEVTDQTPAELKQRLARVRDKLQKTASADSGKATQVTLQGEMTLEEILSQFSRQTGNRVVDNRAQGGESPPEIKLTLDLDKVGFWQAIDTICEQAGLSVYPYPPDETRNTLALVARGEQESPLAERRVVYPGPFRIEVASINARHNFKLTNDRRMNITIDVAWEPRLAPINLQLALADVSATDDEGNAIEVSGMGVRTPGSLPTGTISGEITIPLNIAPRSAKKISSLKGTIMALVPARSETFCFSSEELTNNRPVEKRRAGAAVLLDKIRTGRDQYEMHIYLRFDEAGGALESYLRNDWLSRNEVTLLGPGNEKLERGNAYDDLPNTQEQAGRRYFFEKKHDLKDCILLYTTPSSMMTIPVEFELKDIDLP